MSYNNINSIVFRFVRYFLYHSVWHNIIFNSVLNVFFYEIFDRFNWNLINIRHDWRQLVLKTCIKSYNRFKSHCTQPSTRSKEKWHCCSLAINCIIAVVVAVDQLIKWSCIANSAKRVDKPPSMSNLSDWLWAKQLELKPRGYFQPGLQRFSDRSDSLLSRVTQ